MMEADNDEPKTLFHFLQANPHATEAQIRAFAAQRGVDVSFGFPAEEHEATPEDYGYNKYIYNAEGPNGWSPFPRTNAEEAGDQ